MCALQADGEKSRARMGEWGFGAGMRGSGMSSPPGKVPKRIHAAPVSGNFRSLKGIVLYILYF